VGFFAPEGGASLVQALAPALVAAAGGPARLQGLTWFRSTHQRGGGATGYARYADDNGQTHDAVIKAPVNSIEYRWTVRLAHAQRGEPNPVTPRLYAHGTSMGDYDFAWLILERLPGQPLAGALDGQGVRDMLTAAARLEGLARDIEPITPDTQAKQIDFEAVINKSRDVVRRGVLVAGAEGQHWNNTLKAVTSALPFLLARWRNRPCNAWCHGDLHPGNAMRRADGTLVLIDLALMHTGHWVEDALYLERTSWGRPDGLCAVNPVKELALHRRELAMHDNEDYGMLACVRRVLTASCAPALIEREGNRVYLQAALEIIRRNLPMASH
jgi:hypothetical protein